MQDQIATRAPDRTLPHSAANSDLSAQRPLQTECRNRCQVGFGRMPEKTGMNARIDAQKAARMNVKLNSRLAN